MRTLIAGGLIGVACVFGGACTSQVGPDANTGVFKTPEQAAESRRQRLLVDWQEMALKIANAERPDVRTIKTDGFAIRMSADGVERTVDLSPLTEKLSANVGREREPIRAYLAEQMPPLDRARLAAIGFERAKPMLHPRLANNKQTTAMAAPDTKAPPIANKVVIDLNWVPVVRWGGSGAQTPVDAEMAKAWGVDERQVSDVALANLRTALAKEAASTIETVDLPGLGRYGMLRGGIDPTYVVLPEWLAAVRKEWKTADDLIVFLPSRSSVNFLERKNERLLNQLMPEWSKRVGQPGEGLLNLPVVLGDGGMTLLEHKAPATKPTTAPATKPRVYIVN